MGYLRNHLATVATGAFAAVLTVLWPLFNGLTPLLDFIFLMAVPITWFLTITCWLAQKSVDYVNIHHSSSASHKIDIEKKSLSNNNNNLKSSTTTLYSADGKQVTSNQLKVAKTELSVELDTLRNTVKIKDTEIERLKQEIANLETLVQIESLKTELANLKALASKK